MALTAQEKQRAEQVREYIERHWSASIADPSNPKEGVFALPQPFVTPSDAGPFNGILFYWDSFFANRGLILSGRTAEARSTAEDMFYLIDQLGFVPNYSTPDGAWRSQPPLLAWMVRDIYAAAPDDAFLAQGYAHVKKEHHFWMQHRAAADGLNRYFQTAPGDAQLLEFGAAMQQRLKITVPAEDALPFAVHKLAEAESGWDFNPRFDTRCADFAPVDLNSILYSVECLLADWAAKLAPAEEAGWRQAAAVRRDAMCRHMLAEDGVFYDYDLVRDERSPVLSAASFLPLCAGLATPQQAEAAVRQALPRLMEPFGIAACARRAHMPITYQWDWPNGWAPLQYFVHEGLMRYGYTQPAARLRRAYLLLVTQQLEKTGRLWEKYNVANGTLEVSDEYEMPVLLGWTAGVFLHFLALE